MRLHLAVLILGLSAWIPRLHADPFALNTNLHIRLVLATTNGNGANSVRIAKDPRDNALYIYSSMATFTA